MFGNERHEIDRCPTVDSAALFHDPAVGERSFPPDPDIEVLVQDYKDKIDDLKTDSVLKD